MSTSSLPHATLSLPSPLTAHHSHSTQCCGRCTQARQGTVSTRISSMLKMTLSSRANGGALAVARGTALLPCPETRARIHRCPRSETVTKWWRNARAKGSCWARTDERVRCNAHDPAGTHPHAAGLVISRRRLPCRRWVRRGA
jgi:hypothetical protein